IAGNFWASETVSLIHNGRAAPVERSLEDFSYETGVFNRRRAGAQNENSIALTSCTILETRQKACSTDSSILLWRGPQSPPLKGLLAMVQDLRSHFDRKHPGYKPPNLSVGSMLQFFNLKSKID
ncbi:hypothetical protein QUB33_27490, partial [Microcoleus sp. B3-A4]|uniref:hypothetical protein n=1 Tax=Microcoleus sp. B3-A4 TaxID=2818653 RepID=UPI002FCF4C5E